jgi:uncharacterized protein involved in copper resistance
VKSTYSLDFTETNMNKLMLAVATAIALPAAAFAQATPAATPATSAHSGHDMRSMSCKDMQAMMSAKTGTVDHSKMDHSKMDHSKMDHSKMASCAAPAKPGARQAPADPHANHKK